MFASSYLSCITMGTVFVVLLTCTLFVSSGSDEVYITPNSDHKCQSCYTLDEFCMKHEVVPRDLWVTFLNGEHRLETNCIFNGYRNLTLKGQLATIECSPHQDSGFTFYKVSALLISGITCTGCGVNWSTTKPELSKPKLGYFYIAHIKAAFLFTGGSNHTLINVTVLNAKSAGVFIYNVAGKVILDSCELINASSHSLNTLSGNIVIYDYNVARTTFIVKYSTFKDNGYKYTRKKCTQNNTFSSSSGLAFYLGSPVVTVDVENTNFSHNIGCTGGHLAIFFFNHTSVTISNTKFIGGKALYGGGVFVSFENSFFNKISKADFSNSSRVLHIAHSVFRGNYARYAGGGMYVQWKRSLILNSSYQMEVANSTFVRNYVGIVSSVGLAFHYKAYVDNSNNPYALPLFLVTLNITNCTFTHHQPNTLSAEFQSGSSVILVANAPYFGINGITVEHNNCTGIEVIGSTLVFYNSTLIQNNSAVKGGGIRLCSDAIIYFTPNTTLVVTNNSAHQTGGGIQVYSSCLSSKPACFFQYSKEVAQNSDFSVLSTLTFTVSNNSAKAGGDNIYGGSLDNCYHINVKKGKQLLLSHFHIPNNTISQPSSVSSDPQHVCFNRSQEFHCNKTVNVSIYPGESIALPVYVLGQSFGAASGTVLAIPKSGGAIESHEKAQVCPITGKKISYTVYSSQPDNLTTEEVAINLKPGLHSDTSVFGLYSAVIHVHFKQCPFGFEKVRIGASYYSCKCIVVRNFVIHGSIKNQTIMKPARSWLGVYEMNNQTYLASNKHCPLDYCSNSIQGVKSNAHNLSQDEQCQYNRTGILCGSCPEGWSLVLGSSECRQNCSNLWLLLLVPFALAGLFLVALVHFLNLTVTIGTVCGLIFYANIIRIYDIALLFNHRIPILTKFLHCFLSWLNLDNGIVTCLYSGMEAFGKTLFAFTFPIYIWSIAAVIVFLSNRYIFFTTIVGENGVKVLSTLFLLSYSKVIRTSLSALSLKYLTVHVNSSFSVHKVRWIHDGNIAYFSLNHTVIFAIAILLILLLLPFSVFLLCIKHVYSLSNCSRLFSWVDRLKPFFDTYTGPFKDKARFWTGLLLFVRLFLLVLQIYDFGEHVIQYYIVVIVCLSLLALMASLHGVYKERSLNVLECFFILNIGVIFLILSYKEGSDLLKSILIHILVSSAFLVFLGIVFYHAYIKLSLLGWLKRLKCFNRDAEVDLLNFDEMRE